MVKQHRAVRTDDNAHGVLSFYRRAVNLSEITFFLGTKSSIPPLRNIRHAEALALSRSILNLPVHPDEDKSYYPDLIDALINCCWVSG